MLFADMIIGVLAEAQTCPRATAINAMRATCIEWCEKTRCLTEGSQIVFNGTDVPSEDLDQFVVDLTDAFIDGKRVLVTYMSDDRLDALDDTEFDYAITFADEGNLQLTTAARATAPTAEAPITVDLTLAIAPGPTATEVPALLWQRYSEWLESGAIYRVRAMKGKSWADVESAAYHKDRYEAELQRQKHKQGRNRVNKARQLTVKLSPF